MSRRFIPAVPVCLLLVMAAACGLSTAGTADIAGDGAGGLLSSDASGSGSGGGSGGASSGYSTSGSNGGSGAGDDSGGFDSTSPQGDAAPGTCNFAGTWASQLTINVNWMPQGLNSIILANGSGTIKQWIRGVRVQSGSSVTDTTVVCGVQLPDFTATGFVGGEHYGVVFPPSLFDNNYIPPFTVSGKMSGSGPGATYSAAPAAALLGISLTNPTTDAWPTTVTTSVDMDVDGKPGVTINVATGISPAGTPYSDIPVGVPAPFTPTVRASRLFVAIRQVTVASGTAQDCTHINGIVTIPDVAGKVGIDSHILGCTLDGDAGGDCSSSQASFVDNTQPVFTPTGNGVLKSVKVPTGTTCAAIRQMFP